MRRFYWPILLAALVCVSPARADNPYQISYQQFATAIGCPTSGCVIKFPTVGADTLILNVSCQMVTEEGNVIIAYARLATLNTNYFAQLPVFAYAVQPYHGINASTYLYVAKGDQPIVTISQGAAGLSADCTLSGNQK
jgi:hypothetical protein